MNSLLTSLQPQYLIVTNFKDNLRLDNFGTIKGVLNE